MVGLALGLAAPTSARETPDAEETPVAAAQPVPIDRLWKDFVARETLLGREHSAVPIDAYLAILERWGRQPGVDTVRLHAELSRRLAAEPYCLLEARIYAFEKIAEREPAALFPILVLDVPTWIFNLKTEHLGRLETIEEDLLRWARYTGRRKSEGGLTQQDAAMALVYFAAQAAASPYFNHQVRADAHLDLALDIVPDHPLALHLRAISAERQGKYRRAARDLERLAGLTDRGDVRLRLAIQWLRTGREEKGVRILEGLIESPAEADGGPAEWVSALAYQELARHLADQGRITDALEILDRGRARHPLNERLVLIAADLEGRRARSLGAEAGPRPQHGRNLVAAWSRDLGETPRLFYMKGPVPDLLAFYTQIEQRLEGRRELYLDTLRWVRKLDRGGVHECAGLWRNLQLDSVAEPGLHDRQTGRVPPRTIRSQRSSSFGGDDRSPNVRIGARPTLQRTSPTRTTPYGEPETDDGDDDGGESPPRATAPIGAETSPQPSTDDTPPETSAETTSPAIDTEAYTEPYVDTLPPGIRVDEVVEVELQQIYVTARRFGQRVDDLEAHEITLRDEGQEQEIVTFARGDVPFTAILLLDASESMAGSGLERALEGARTFVEGMGLYDRARILAAADRIRDLSPFVSAGTRESAALRRAIDRSSAGGSTALFDHLFLAAETLGEEQGRRVVILLSDGFDTLSAIPVESVREIVRRRQVQVYWVHLEPEAEQKQMPYPPTAWRSTGDIRDQTRMLKELIEESGGEVIGIEGPDQVEPTFAAILEDLRNQLALGYEPTPRHGDGRWREVEVGTSRWGVRLRHGVGYVDH